MLMSSPASATVAALAEELTRQQVTLPADQMARLADYCHWLWDWNERVNLTRHTDFAKFVSRDLVDTLELAKVLDPGARVLDVGSGGGVPGLVLAIVRPDLQIALSDSVGKKARILADIVQRIGLQVPVHAGAAQELLAEEYYDALTARAVAPLAKLLTWFAPHWGAIGRLLVIKGPAWVEERQEARQRNLFSGLQLRKLATWPLPGTHSESVLLEIRPQEE